MKAFYTVIRKNVTKFALLLLLPLVLAGCSETSRFSNFESLPAKGWAYGDTVSIAFPGVDSVMSGTLCVALRHNNDYGYSNLWMEVTVPVDGGDSVCDTVNITMADPYGQWFGSGFGAGYQLTDTLYNNISIDLGRPFYVRHIMRVDTLADIDMVGLTFKPLDL